MKYLWINKDTNEEREKMNEWIKRKWLMCEDKNE